MTRCKAITVVFLVAGLVPAARAQRGNRDIDGIWTNGYATPMERPRNLGDQAFYSAEEVAAFEKAMRERPDAGEPVADPEVW